MERHGFVSFWLWAGVISGGIFIPFLLFLPDYIISNKFICNFFGLSGCISYILILNWKKLGFYLFCFGNIFGIFINTQNSFIALSIFSSIIGILIFFGILNIKKNGISTWDYLNGKQNIYLKKCPFCANDIKKEAILCQFCNRDMPKEKAINQEMIDNKQPAVIKDDNEYELKICRSDIFDNLCILINVRFDDGDTNEFYLRNIEERIIKVKKGKHIIAAYFDNMSDKQEFEINNTNLIFSIDIAPVKINMM